MLTHKYDVAHADKAPMDWRDSKTATIAKYGDIHI